jgi:RNA polymerase sigma-70 factor (ECF subfamily)
MQAESTANAVGAELSQQASVSIVELIEHRAGMNEDAFRLFYERTARPLWAYLLRVSGRHDVADDLLQESYCRFLSADLPVMDAAESKSYLFRVATNLLHDRWRRSKHESPVTAQDEPELVDLEGSADVRRAFDQLKPRERQLLWLAYVEGSNHKEIAGLTGLRAGSIRLLLFRARRKLADVLRRGVESTAKKVGL